MMCLIDALPVRRLVRLLLGVSLVISSVGAGPREPMPPSPSETIASGKHHPHCGLYCLYVAMRLSGRDIRFTELVRPEYIGSRTGSSLAEPERAAETYGLHAASVSRLTTGVLPRLPYPVILHVKSSLESLDYDHYELFLEMQGKKAKVLDPSRGASLVALEDLAPRWDGKGLVLSTQPIVTKSLMRPAWMQTARYGALGFLGVCLARLLQRRYFHKLSQSRRPLRTVGHSMVQVVLVLTAGLGAAMVFQLENRASFLSHPCAATALQKAHMARFIPKMSVRRVSRLQRGEVVVVDARLPVDYEAGHLADAIHIPVNASDRTRRERIARVPIQAAVVVYCQSAACTFAEKVALKLIDDGYSNVSILRGGWEEWVRRQPGKDSE